MGVLISDIAMRCHKRMWIFTYLNVQQSVESKKIPNWLSLSLSLSLHLQHLDLDRNYRQIYILNYCNVTKIKQNNHDYLHKN